MVQAERLELSHLAALDPKSSVSTNSTTPALINLTTANINKPINLQREKLYFSTLNLRFYIVINVFFINTYGINDIPYLLLTYKNKIYFIKIESPFKHETHSYLHSKK